MTATRRLSILMAVERHEEGYFRSVMRGDRGPIVQSEKGLLRLVENELRHITRDATITLLEFHEMCRATRHQSAQN